MFLAADAAEAIRHHLRWFDNLSNHVQLLRPDLSPGLSDGISKEEIERKEAERWLSLILNLPGKGTFM